MCLSTEGTSKTSRVYPSYQVKEDHARQDSELEASQADTDGRSMVDES